MKMSVREAINLTLHEEMVRDPRVVIMGEDVASGQGGVYGVTAGLTEKFGVARGIDTPITESAIVGAAGGAALTGLRPVAELMFIDFLGVCLPVTQPNCKIPLHVWRASAYALSDKNYDWCG